MFAVLQGFGTGVKEDSALENAAMVANIVHNILKKENTEIFEILPTLPYFMQVQNQNVFINNSGLPTSLQ